MEYEELRQQCLAYAGFSPYAKVNILEILEQMRKDNLNILASRLCFHMAKHIEELRDKTA
ncbi:hypothetical protein KAX02_02775 [candidate division WOR-3 bacterium]|nr:hypothetical protein [candidate division WOR-3 bacterium]